MPTVYQYLKKSGVEDRIAKAASVIIVVALNNSWGLTLDSIAAYVQKEEPFQKTKYLELLVSNAVDVLKMYEIIEMNKRGLYQSTKKASEFRTDAPNS